MKFTNRTNLDASQLADLEQDLLRHKTLKDVLLWGHAQAKDIMHPHIIADIVEQDEYTHDIIVPWQNGLAIVYGAT